MDRFHEECYVMRMGRGHASALRIGMTRGLSFSSVTEHGVRRSLLASICMFSERWRRVMRRSLIRGHDG